MNKTLLFSILILGIFVISGCAKQIVDCGTDAPCFYKNFRSCTPSKVSGGAMEVKGGSIKACDVYFEGDNPSFENGELKHEKVTMECTVTNTDTYKDTAINGYDIAIKNSCSGTLYDIYLKIKQSADQMQKG